MKTPPFLVGAALLFWGWQSDLLVAGLLMGLVLESARWVKVRWEFSTVDFERLWTFCALLFLAAAVYAFTSNDVPSAFSSFLDNPTVSGSHNAGTATSRAAAAWIRWQPMLFFLFVAAQTYSTGEGVPAETISLLLRWRWRRTPPDRALSPERAAARPEYPENSESLGHSRRAEDSPPCPGRLGAARTVDVSYPYVGLCLVAASAHASDNQVFFCGLGVLLGWALWPLASPRFSRLAWAATLVSALALGYGGQRGLGHLQHYLEALNPQWPFHFGRSETDPLQSHTALGDIGGLKLSGRIVVRLKVKSGKAPAYLREAAYRRYNTRVWYSETTSNDFNLVIETNGTYVLVPGKTNGAVASIGCYLPGGTGLLPLPSGCGRVENRLLSLVEKSPLGAVLAQGPGLVLFDAQYGPGPTLDGPPTAKDLELGREVAALDKTLAELHPEGLSRDEKLQALQAFFAKHFTYSTWQKPVRRSWTNEPPLTRFLLRTRRGHCEYFATAGVLLLRRMHIPARYAVGYAVHEHSGPRYVVRERDGHAWCLVWNEAAGIWEDFDPTPPSWIETEEARASFFQPLNDLWSGLTFELSKLRWGQTRLREYILWGLAPLLGLLLYQIVFRSQRRRRRLPDQGVDRLREWPGADSEFYRLEARLRERGLGRAPSESLSDWLARVAADPALAGLQPTLQALLRLHYRLRFDPLGLDPAEREALRGEAAACLEQLARR